MKCFYAFVAFSSVCISYKLKKREVAFSYSAFSRLKPANGFKSFDAPAKTLFYYKRGRGSL